VRFTVTPLGGARSDVGRAVNGIVRYLQPPELADPTPDGPARDGIEGPSRYYADRGEGLVVGWAEPLPVLACPVRSDGTTSLLFCPVGIRTPVSGSSPPRVPPGGGRDLVQGLRLAGALEARPFTARPMRPPLSA